MVALSTVTSDIEHDTAEKARNAAMEDAASTGGMVFPCTVFRQGGRIMISTSFPFTVFANFVRLNPAAKGGDPRVATNRPLMPDHVRTIQDYVLSNREEYILPPVTLNVQQMPQVHVHKTNAAVRSGFLVVDSAAQFAITDGQHRIAAIVGHSYGKSPTPGVIDHAPDMKNHGMAVLITVEDDLERVHQDFADAAQTKQIPASLLAAYNMREPVNRVLTRIVRGSQLLNGRVDETSKTLPKYSQSVFLLNQVRGLVKELLFSDYALSDDMLSRQAAKRLGTNEAQQEFVRQSLQLLETLTNKMTPWDQVASFPAHDSVANQIPDFRRDFVNMTATGLVIIGRVAYEINKLPQEAERLAKYTELATEIDWRRTAEIWQGAIVTSEGKIVTNRGPVRTAATRVKELLQLKTD